MQYIAPISTLNSKSGGKYSQISTIRVHILKFKPFLGILVHMEKFGDAYVLHFNYLKVLFFSNFKLLLILLLRFNLFDEV